MMRWDVYNYDSPRAAELPQDFVADLLEELTQKQHWIVKHDIEARKNRDEKALAYVKEQQTRLNGALELLDSVGLHAAYNWAGENKRRRYIFPSYADCEMQEDWIWQCRED